MRPTGDRIVVEQIETPRHEVLWVPDSAARELEYRLGRVIAVGRGRRLADGSFEPPPVAVGATVLWRKFTGHEAEGVVILSSDEVLAEVEL